MRTTPLLTTVLLAIPTLAAAEVPLVVGPPTPDGLVFGRHPVPDDPNVSASARAQSRTVYLNRNGVTLIPGSNDARINRSSIIGEMATIPPWDASPGLWAQTVTCMREMFAPFDVAITETDPGNVPHIEAVFGGSPAMLGFAGKFAGVSPFSSSCKVIENSIVFTFTDVIPQSAQVACEIMAQEIAHSYGLDHELLPSDPMTYLSYSGKRTFQDEMAECGETTPRACGLQGSPMCREKQNSYALLMERIGAAGTGDIDPPTVGIMQPQDGAIVEAGFTITASVTDDVAVKFAALSIDGVAHGSLTAAPWTFVAPADLAPGRHVIEIKATDGANEQIATIEVTVRGADGALGEDDATLAGCASTGGHGGPFGLLLLVLVAIQRRAQR